MFPVYSDRIDRFRKWLSSGLLRRIVEEKFTDISEVLAASFYGT
jgi:hypothetical protein